MAQDSRLNTVINAVADSTEMKGGTAKKRKRLRPESVAEEMYDKKRGIKETAAEDQAEILRYGNKK